MDIGIGRYGYPMRASSRSFEVGYALGTGKDTKKINFLTTEKNKKGGKQINLNFELIKKEKDKINLSNSRIFILNFL